MTSQGFPRLLKELRQIDSASLRLQGQASLEWGARTLGSRQQLRRSIANTLSELSDADVQALDDLSQPPRLENYCVSISHTHTLGGWMSIPRPAQIGWDVELQARIKLRTIERVCTAEELDAAPRPEFLWCAKEAYFKSLEDEQPLAIPQLTIDEWRQDGVSMWRWRGLGPRNGEGILIVEEPWFMAASFIGP